MLFCSHRSWQVCCVSKCTFWINFIETLHPVTENIWRRNCQWTWSNSSRIDIRAHERIASAAAIEKFKIFNVENQIKNKTFVFPWNWTSSSVLVPSLDAKAKQFTITSVPFDSYWGKIQHFYLSATINNIFMLFRTWRKTESRYSAKPLRIVDVFTIVFFSLHLSFRSFM